MTEKKKKKFTDVCTGPASEPGTSGPSTRRTTDFATRSAKYSCFFMSLQLLLYDTMFPFVSRWGEIFAYFNPFLLPYEHSFDVYHVYVK